MESGSSGRQLPSDLEVTYHAVLMPFPSPSLLQFHSFMSLAPLCKVSELFLINPTWKERFAQQQVSLPGILETWTVQSWEKAIRADTQPQEVTRNGEQGGTQPPAIPRQPGVSRWLSLLCGLPPKTSLPRFCTPELEVRGAALYLLWAW